MVNQLKILVIVMLAVTYADGALADEKQEAAIAGSYLLTQDDKFQRVLTFEAGGAVFQVSDQQTLLGFSSGQGAWKQTGPNSATARVIDFSFDLKTGKRVGPGIIVYEFNFSDQKSGKFQSLAGKFSGSVYPVGDNPLKPTMKPVYSFSVGFSGDRVGAE